MTVHIYLLPDVNKVDILHGACG